MECQILVAAKGFIFSLTARWGPAQNVFQYCVTEQKEKEKSKIFNPTKGIAVGGT